MKATFRNNDEVIEISQTNREDWEPYLILVLTNPHRLLGICTQSEGTVATGQPIKLEHVCVYASQIGFQPSPDQKGMRLVGHRLVIPFDGVASFHHHTAYNYTGITWISNEPKDSPLRDLLVSGYLNLFAPSQLVLPSADQQKKVLNS